jgi:hypothetical protein
MMTTRSKGATCGMHLVKMCTGRIGLSVTGASARRIAGKMRVLDANCSLLNELLEGVGFAQKHPASGRV